MKDIAAHRRRRASFLTGVRDIAPLVPAGLSFGLVAGAAITQAGLGLAESAGMSAGVYGASAQLAATLLWSAGAPLTIVVGTALVINARFFIYSASLAPVLRPKGPLAAIGLGYLVRDGAYAATMTRAVPNPDIDEVPYFLGAAGLDWLVWLVATSAGALGASLVPKEWSLDFIVPLVFVSLLAVALEDRVAKEAAIVGAVAAALLLPLLPLGSGLLAALLIGMLWGFARAGARSAEGRA